MDTAVHEQCHAYTHIFKFSLKEGIVIYNRYYTGNKKSIKVKPTKVFRSKKMAKAIPKRLRTDRYEDYIGKAEKNLSSNKEGVYGLLNEFCAYSWGMHNSVQMYDYFSKFPFTEDTWNRYVLECENDSCAYAEFKYYILFYMDYARKHYPKIYKKILKNKKFRKAYKKVERNYSRFIRKYKHDLKALANKYRRKGFTISITDDAFVVSKGEDILFSLLLYTEEYKPLLKEISKPKYKKLHKKIIK